MIHSDYYQVNTNGVFHVIILLYSAIIVLRTLSFLNKDTIGFFTDVSICGKVIETSQTLYSEVRRV